MNVKFLKPLLVSIFVACSGVWGAEERPNIVLMMSDDQGWGETGYNGHPHLKTPVLDEMAAGGLRLDRFYAASSVCTPTRASVMTGRHANRCGAFIWNWSIRPEEITLPRILKDAGYRTAHFGKWHIGAIKKGSPLSPNALGFDESLAHDNFFELNPELSRNGEPPQQFFGEGSEVVVREALDFIKRTQAGQKPFFVVIWFGSPHAPYHGLDEDVALYNELGGPVSHRFAEITAMDRAIGRFRDGLGELGVRENTLLWFNSDNGITYQDIPKNDRQHLYNGGLKGSKGKLTEGGVRVPCVIEWPAVISSPNSSSMPCVTSDMMPTLLDLLDLQHPDPERPMDGVSLKPLLTGMGMEKRPSSIGFWSYNYKPEQENEAWIADPSLTGMITMTEREKAKKARQGASYRPGCFMNFKHPHPKTDNFGGAATWMNNRFKLIQTDKGDELYDIAADPKETRDVAALNPEVVETMKKELTLWQQSVERSLSGADYDLLHDASVPGELHDEPLNDLEKKIQGMERLEFVPESIRGNDPGAKNGLQGPHAGIGTNKDDKYCQRWTGSAYLEMSLKAPRKAVFYTISSSNDRAIRSPKEWVLSGSNDGIAWTELDRRSGEHFKERFELKGYSIPTPGAYQHYKLDILKNNGTKLMQFSRFGLFAEK